MQNFCVFVCVCVCVCVCVARPFVSAEVILKELLLIFFVTKLYELAIAAQHLNLFPV